MSNNSPSARSYDNQSFYDIESEYSSQDFANDPNILRNNNINDNNNINTKYNKNLIFNRTIYVLCLSSISFIIYEHYEIIGFYLSQIGNIF
jgi:hypothetical protein